jgi:multisubunit Na+/H+ antiporter MnhG subunit
MRDGDRDSDRRSVISGPQPEESPKERVDRELGELLEEIRVVLPGVEILFGFLILLPFQFSDELGQLERLLYLGAFLSVSAALALLVAPTVYHRVNFRHMDKLQLIGMANRMVIAASALLAAGIALAVYLVVETLVGGVVAAIIAAANAGWFAWLWFAIPLRRRGTTGR